jgi:transposase
VEGQFRAATPAAYRDLLAWARGLGEVDAWGVEGTGSYGAALARFLVAHGQVVLEVNRPDRQARRRRGKSDPLDAEAAARAVQAGEVSAVPKAGDATVEMIRSLRVARATAVKARTQAINALNALKALVVTASATLREQLRGQSAAMLVREAAGLRPGPLDDPTAAAKLALRTLARRHLALSAEIATLNTELDRLDRLDRLVAKAAPGLVALFGVGPHSAGALLVAAGDNPERLRSDACFAMLCGSSPIEASSGKITRHRLNRGGDRQATDCSACWTWRPCVKATRYWRSATGRAPRASPGCPARQRHAPAQVHPQAPIHALGDPTYQCDAMVPGERVCAIESFRGKDATTCHSGLGGWGDRGRAPDRVHHWPQHPVSPLDSSLITVTVIAAGRRATAADSTASGLVHPGRNRGPARPHYSGGAGKKVRGQDRHRL